MAGRQVLWLLQKMQSQGPALRSMRQKDVSMAPHGLLTAGACAHDHMQDRFSVIMLYSTFTWAARDKSFQIDSYRHSYTDLRWMCISLACEISQK